MTQAIGNLKAYLSGPWAFLRHLDDRRLMQPGSIVGWAAFDPDGAGLVYREQGRLWFGGAQGEATRCYLYRFTEPEQAAAEVAFEDGRLFHRLCLSDGRCSVEHRCNDDRYRGTFEALGANTLRVCWQAEGPCKDYRLTTDYLRYAAPAQHRERAVAHAA